MDTLSESYIREHCPHCDRTSQAFASFLEETEYFFVVCDGHPIIEGHILIIPKSHISCLGEYSDELFNEFFDLYKKVSTFIEKSYGTVATFEHGKVGQTVFHSHIHLLPSNGKPEDIVPEGKEYFTKIANIQNVRKIYQRDGKFLFFSIGNQNWVVNTTLSTPRFFRDRFARGLGRPERGNWKEMAIDEEVTAAANLENQACKKKWRTFFN